MRKAPALRLILECVAELCSEIGGRTVIVWFPGRGFGDRGIVEFGELNEIVFFFTGRGILERFFN